MSVSKQASSDIDAIPPCLPEPIADLFPLVYDELRAIAKRQLGGGSVELGTGTLVHETYFKLARIAPAACADRAGLLALAARAMRQVLVDHVRSRQRQKRGGDWRRTTLSDRDHGFEVRLEEMLALDEALERLGALSARLRTVVECRFFGGMEEREIAEVLGVSSRTVERDWIKARLFLHRELHPEAARK